MLSEWEEHGNAFMHVVAARTECSGSDRISCRANSRLVPSGARLPALKQGSVSAAFLCCGTCPGTCP
jgi:hypothetical protein